MTQQSVGINYQEPDNKDDVCNEYQLEYTKQYERNLSQLKVTEMQKIITEIKNSQTTWRKSFYAALVIAVVLFFLGIVLWQNFG